MRAGDRLSYVISSVLKEFSLTMVQFNILRILRGARPEKLGVGQVKDRVLFSNADVSRLLDRLVAKELVQREICPNNRRKMDVCIGEKGLDLLKVIEARTIEATGNFFSSTFSLEEAKKLTEQLKKIQ